MADPESCLNSALCTVSVHADSVWWHEAKDKYRLANLNLWLHVLRTRTQPPQSDFQDDRVPPTCRCPKNLLDEVELPEELIPDPEAWLKGHSWPVAIARNFPAISIALIGEHSFCRGLELLSEQNLPYAVETKDEMKLYRRTCTESVRNIWPQLKPETNTLTKRRRDCSPSANVLIQDFFCPSVLQIQRQVNSYPTYPAISDHTYRSELFPYSEQNVEPPPNQEWPLSNRVQSHVAIYQQPLLVSPECYGDWRARQNSMTSLLVLQRPSGERNQRLQRAQQQSGQQPQHILLSSDFPELPNRGNEPSVSPSPMRKPFLPDPGNFTEGRAVDMAELTDWLQTVYPQRAKEFSAMAALASKFQEVARKIIGSTEQDVSPPRTDVEQQIVQEQTCPEGKRLYRDVVASKQEEDSETNIKFEQLEREALEQYFENDNEEVPEVDLSLEVERKFLVLERQAIEQYEEDTEIENQLAIEETMIVSSSEPKNEEIVQSPPKTPHILQDPEELKYCSRQQLDDTRVNQSLSLGREYVIVPQESKTFSSAAVGIFSKADSQDAGSQRCSDIERGPAVIIPTLSKEDSGQRTKTSELPETQEPRRRGRKEPAPAPSCARLPRRTAQELRNTNQGFKSTNKCEKRYGAKKQWPSGSSYQERSRKKGPENLRKTFYKKKEPSPKSTALPNKKRPPPLCVVDKEVKTLADSLKTRILNYLKDVDMKMLAAEHSKVSLRELLYKKQQKESVRKEIRISDIEDTGTLRLYVREMGGLARQQMQLILKRVRDEVVDMTSRQTIFIPQPTTAEKRKVRYLIKKCVELMGKAESLKKLPKKPLESSKKELSDTLTTIHKTMDVVYSLRNMCRETYEDIEHLKSCRETVLELLLGQSFLEDKEDSIRQRVVKDKLPLLLFCLYPRRESLLLDRRWAKLESQPNTLYIAASQQILNNTLLLNHQCSEWTPGVKQMRLLNEMVEDKPRRKDLWSEGTWQKSLVVGSHSCPVDVMVEGPVSLLSLSADIEPINAKNRLKPQTVLESKGSFHVDNVIQPSLDLWPKFNSGEIMGSVPWNLKPPMKRKVGSKSDSELQCEQPTRATERSYWTWPKTCKTSNLLRLLKAQPKHKKKPPVKNDSACSVM